MLTEPHRSQSFLMKTPRQVRTRPSRSVRTRRLTESVYRAVRPTLALQPRREHAYIALDALAWAVARILDGLEDRDAMDFFTLALTQRLADYEKAANGKPND
jgi:hypothetical protein